MIGLTAGLTLLVGALGSTLVMWLPVIILATLGPAFTFSFFHWVWAKLNHMIGFKKEKGVEVWKLDDVSVYENSPYYKYHGDHYYEDWGDIKYEAYYDKKKKKYRSRIMENKEKFKNGVLVDKA